MSEWNQRDNQNINNLDRTRMLRREAALLEEKERVRSRLVYLMNLSEDDYYSRYLEQMLKDLESGKATPAQVEREAWRSYDKYRQKMAPAWKERAVSSKKDRKSDEVILSTWSGSEKMLQTEPNGSNESCSQKNTIEFKIGRNVFSIIGAVFVLVALAILGFHFWGGIGAMAVTLLIAVGFMFAGRKTGSAVLRIMGLAGCYASFFAVREFETELNFLVIAGMLLAANGISIFFQNRKYQTFINIFHILILVLGTSVFTGIAWFEGIHSVYLAFYVITSFLLINVLSLKQCMGKEKSIFPVCCIGNSIFLMMLFFIGYFGPEMSEPDMALFMHLMVETLMTAVCLVTFLLWEKADGKRWAQLYYAVAVVFLFSCFSEYSLEIFLSGLGIFLIVKVASGHMENIVLDCLVTAWTGILCYRLADNWYAWVLAGALLLSALLIRHMHIYYEIVITVSLLLLWGVRYRDFLRVRFALDSGWFYLVSAVILLLLFLIFNHLPQTGKKEQKIYNVINIIMMMIYYQGVWFCYSYVFSSVMMVLGAVAILVIFRSRYGLGIRGKSLVLAGFLTWFSIAGHYELPVITSILLMVIALGCVGAGFKLRSKMERICGLIMAAFVCLKLVIYDFREVEIIYRVLVFLIVGIIALLISFIYVRLEKNVESLSIRQSDTAAFADSEFSAVPEEIREISKNQDEE